MNNLVINGNSYNLVEMKDGVTLNHSTPFVSIEGKIYVGEASKKEWWQELADLTKEQWTEFTEKEEVQQDEKKDWEIVKIEYNGSIIPLQDGWYVFGEHPQQRFKFGDIPKDVKIHSIKRLSDGETFSIGDYLEDRLLPIIQIRIGTYNSQEQFIDGGENVWLSTAPYVGRDLSVAQKRKEIKIILTTRDGVEYKEGQEKEKVYALLTKSLWEKRTVSVATAISLTNKAWNFFSTEYAREEFELSNRPMFSAAYLLVHGHRIINNMSPTLMKYEARKMKSGYDGL